MGLDAFRNLARVASEQPAILLSSAELGLMARPVRPAIAPKVTKTREKPITKLSEWRNKGRRLLAVPVSSISGPYKLARYNRHQGHHAG